MIVRRAWHVERERKGMGDPVSCRSQACSFCQPIPIQLAAAQHCARNSRAASRTIADYLYPRTLQSLNFSQGVVFAVPLAGAVFRLSTLR